MMEKDDFLRELIQKSPLDSPSDDFVERVMAHVQLAPEIVPVNKPYLFYVKAAIPYAVLTMVLVMVISTSDLPFLRWLPGQDYFLSTFASSFGSLFSGLRNVFASKYVSFGLLIGASAGLLYIIDRWFGRRSAY